VTEILDRVWVERRFADRPGVPPHTKIVSDISRERGDHALNEGMMPSQPLKPAAVLVPFVERPAGMTLLFTLRTAHLAHHAGQVSFPGGHIEENDHGPAETALRETEEEIGLDRRRIDVISHLDTYVTRTGFIVTPVVGIVTPPFDIVPDAHEVAEVFEVPLAHFLDPANHHRCSAEFDGVARHFFAMPYHNYFIWGATAGMLMNMYEILCRR
jgi:8-oxo-dGTP pyrophosphatase MutT (NUDIX family)